jgi:high-affinity Fe2+/Pb2+ permease
LATRTWSLPLVWTLALGSVLFVARIGGSARLPSALGWAGLAVACALALTVFIPTKRLALAARLRGTTARSS